MALAVHLSSAPPPRVLRLVPRPVALEQPHYGRRRLAAVAVLGAALLTASTAVHAIGAALIDDPVAQAAFAEAGRRLGQVLAGVAANLLNLDGVVITGGASESLDLMRPALENEIARRAFGVPTGRLQIVRGRLGDDAGILGAASLAFGRLDERQEARTDFS